MPYTHAFANGRSTIKRSSTRSSTDLFLEYSRRNTFNSQQQCRIQKYAFADERDPQLEGRGHRYHDIRFKIYFPRRYSYNYIHRVYKLTRGEIDRRTSTPVAARGWARGSSQWSNQRFGNTYVCRLGRGKDLLCTRSRMITGDQISSLEKAVRYTVWSAVYTVYMRHTYKVYKVFAVCDVYLEASLRYLRNLWSRCRFLKFRFLRCPKKKTSSSTIQKHVCCGLEHLFRKPNGSSARGFQLRNRIKSILQYFWTVLNVPVWVENGNNRKWRSLRSTWDLHACFWDKARKVVSARTWVTHTSNIHW